ncbi:MAG: hypothetical protein J4A00_06070 [Gammaproteobacteria bacterium]|nr:hypothetical protein [Gammaproteobacteria bacterium]
MVIADTVDSRLLEAVVAGYGSARVFQRLPALSALDFADAVGITVPSEYGTLATRRERLAARPGCGQSETGA